MTTYKGRVYIDGLNFYHSIVGWIQNKEISPYPSMMKFCENKLTSFPTKKHEFAKKFAKINIEKIYLDEIHYFTAIVKESYEDLQKPRRHEEYINALEIEKVKVTLGEHKRDPETGKLKEKQTDVNLATRFVYDTCNEKCNYAVIISNDTDFCKAIKFVLEKYPEMIVDVWTVEPTSPKLCDAASICQRITLKDFIGVPQIANFGFNPSSVKKMP